MEDLQKFAQEDVCEEVLLPDDAENHVFLEERVALNELMNDTDLVHMAVHVDCAPSPPRPEGATDKGSAGLEPVETAKDEGTFANIMDNVEPT